MKTFIIFTTVFQAVTMFMAAYYTWKIAHSQFTPSRPWYMIMTAKILFAFQRVNSLIYTLFFYREFEHFAKPLILFGVALQTILCIVIYLGISELYALMKVKYTKL